MISLLLAITLKLPLIEVPATSGASDTLVVFVSGDGGWAAIDKSISKVLAANGTPVVGLNALQYFWTKRTPESAARDLQSVVQTYLATWKKNRVVFVGYSRGADVLPAMIARLPNDTKSRIRLIALLGPSPKVQFEFHMTEWLHDSAAGLRVAPEIDKLTAQRVLCLWGHDDKDSLCPAIGGAYEKLAGIILEHMK
jgi:type IV secretory pathway VirJ component